MRVRGQTLPTHFATKVFELRLANHALEIGARIHTRRAVPLVIHQIAGVAITSASKKVIHPDVVERCAR